jgi:4-methyl-5(b-hydroxyethyl)-thiazole monophosphate biosynthesis
LQAADMLDKRTVTCHPGVATDLTDSPRSSQRVIKSGNLITSQGPGTAMEFALAIIEQLSDKATAEKVKAGLVI